MNGRGARVLAGTLLAAQLGGLSLPVVAALFGVAVLALAAICWVINDEGRSERLSMIIQACATLTARRRLAGRHGRHARTGRLEAIPAPPVVIGRLALDEVAHDGAGTDRAA